MKGRRAANASDSLPLAIVASSGVKWLMRFGRTYDHGTCKGERKLDRGGILRQIGRCFWFKTFWQIGGVCNRRIVNKESNVDSTLLSIIRIILEYI